MKKLIFMLFCTISMSAYAVQKNEDLEYLVVKKEAINLMEEKERNYVAKQLSDGIWEFNKNKNYSKLENMLNTINTNVSHPIGICIGNNVIVVIENKNKCSDQLTINKTEVLAINKNLDI